MSGAYIVNLVDQVAIITDEGSPVAIIIDGGIQGPAGVGSAMRTDVISLIVNGQTVFTLLADPLAPSAVQMFVNGVRAGASDFTVLGRTVTWTNLFSISATDAVEFTYPV
jgi:hypothetical protein